MNKENCSLNLVDEIILYYDARSKKHQILTYYLLETSSCVIDGITLPTISLLHNGDDKP